MTPTPNPPQTLPGDFFDKLDQQQGRQQPMGTPPQTLPGDFFDKLDQQNQQNQQNQPATPDDGWGTFRREHPILSLPTDFLQGMGAGVMQTARGLNQIVSKGASYLPGSPQIPVVIPDQYTKAPTGLAGSAGKVAEQTAEFLLPGGAIGKAGKAVEAARLPYAAELLTKGALEAVPAAGITYAQTGGDAGAAATSGAVSGVLGAALPLAGEWAKHMLGKRTGVGVEAIEKAVQGSPEFEAGLTNKISESDILDTAREALDGLKEDRRVQYTAALQKLPQNQPLSLKPVRNDFLSSLAGHRITYRMNPNTWMPVLDFSRSPVKTDPAAMEALQNTANDLWMWGSRSGDMTTSGVDSLKRIIDARFNPKMQGRAIVQTAKNGVRDILNKVPGYEQMTKGYAEASDLLDNMTDLSMHVKNDGTAIRKLTTILNQNNGYRSSLLEALSKRAGVDIGAMIAGNRMSAWAPRGIAGPLHAVSMFSPQNLATWLGAMTLSSPRAAARVVQGAAKVGPLVPRIAGSMPSLLDTSWQPDTSQTYQGVGPPAQLDYNAPGKAKGGRVHYDEGGDVEQDDASQDPKLQELIRRRIPSGTIQLGKPTYQQPFTINPEQSKQNLNPDYQNYANPMTPPPPAKIPALPVPMEMQLQQTQPQKGDLLDQFILNPMTRGSGKIASAAEEFSEPAPETKQLGLSTITKAGSGLMEVGTPFMLGSGLSSPTALLNTVKVLGGANIAQGIVEHQLEEQGYSPEVTQFGGMLTGVLAGGLLHGAGSPEAEVPVTLGDVKDAARDLIPTRAGLEATSAQARANLSSKNAFEPGMTFYSGNPLDNAGDAAKLIMADLGIKTADAAGLALAKSRRLTQYLQEKLTGKPAEGTLKNDLATSPSDVRTGGGELSPAAQGAPVSSTQQRPPADPALQAVVNAYNTQNGLSPIDHSQYHPLDENFSRRVADAYEGLQQDNSADPNVRAAYEALQRETKAQFQHLQANGYTLEPWPDPGSQPYANSHEMAADLRDNKHLWFFTGGEPHPFLSAIDPETGHSYNDMFRAIHDPYGHAAGGYGFGPRGEEGAHDAHSQSFSPLARQAMTTETRGQNSWVNFGQHNYDAEGNHLGTPAAERPFAQQNVDLLPPELQVRAGERASVPANFQSQTPDTIRMLQIHGAQKILAGYADPNAWAQSMVSDLGQAVVPHLNDLWQGANDIASQANKNVKARTMDTLDARIPDDARVVSPDATRTTTGQSFHNLDLDQKSEGFLPYRKYGEQAADQMEQQMLQEAIQESEAGGGTTAADAVRSTRLRLPGSKFWDESFSLPQRARFWYELSGEAFTHKYMDVPREFQPAVIDAVAGTSGGVEPGDNLERAIGILSENLQKQPVMTDLRDEASARKALDPQQQAEKTLKYGSFSGTMQYTAGLTPKAPLTTNDVQVASMFGIKGTDLGKNPVLYEVLSRFYQKMRDAQNAEMGIVPHPQGGWQIPQGVQPWETWQMQAPSWVQERIRKNPLKASQYDDYSQVFPKIIQKLQAAGVPTPGGKITMETLMDPRTPNIMSGTRQQFLDTPVGTAEVATTRTPRGARANALAKQIEGLDPNLPMVKKTLGGYEQVQRNTMQDLAMRRTIKKGTSIRDIANQLQMDTKAPPPRAPNTPWVPTAEEIPWVQTADQAYLQQLYEKAATAKDGVTVPSVVSQLMSHILGQKVDVSRLDWEGWGTYKGDITPNLRIPMGGTTGSGKWLAMNDVQREAFLSILGQHLQQEAMASSHFQIIPHGPADTYSVFLNRYDGHLDPAAVKLFRERVGYEVNVKQHANGTMINVNKGDALVGPTREVVANALQEAFGNDRNIQEAYVFANKYDSNYVTRDKYGKKIQAHARAEAAQTQDQLRGSRRGSPTGTAAGDASDLARVQKVIRNIAKERDAQFEQWRREAEPKYQRYVAKNPPASPPPP